MSAPPMPAEYHNTDKRHFEMTQTYIFIIAAIDKRPAEDRFLFSLSLTISATGLIYSPFHEFYRAFAHPEDDNSLMRPQRSLMPPKLSE